MVIQKRIDTINSKKSWNGGCVTQLTHALEQPPNHGVGPLHQQYRFFFNNVDLIAHQYRTVEEHKQQAMWSSVIPWKELLISCVK